MSTGGSSKIATIVEGSHVVCAEFKQAMYPLKWRKYMCAECGALREEHGVSKACAMADDRMGITEEQLPPRKRLMLRYERDQKALAAATTAATEKGKEQEELEEEEEEEISWSPPAATVTKGKRAPRRKLA
ncbi:hypothetical protein ACQ4PT_019584 [Festuca glaucescens]